MAEETEIHMLAWFIIFFHSTMCHTLSSSPTQKLHRGLYGTWQTSCPSTHVHRWAFWNPQRSRVTLFPSEDSSISTVSSSPACSSSFPSTNGLTSSPPAHAFDRSDQPRQASSRFGIPQRSLGAKPKCDEPHIQLCTHGSSRRWFSCVLPRLSTRPQTSLWTYTHGRIFPKTRTL